MGESPRVKLAMTTEKLIPSHTEPFRSLLLFGPPGAGKGTLGKFLSSAGNHCHLSSGDIFRTLSPESPAGKLYHQYASKGHLLPDAITVEIWHHYVHGLIATNRYFPSQQLLLLDGIPRTPAQVELLNQHVTVERILLLEVSHPDALFKRIQRRAVIEKRHDDLDPTVLRTRFEVYEKETKQVLSRYPAHLITRFNADLKPLEVLRDVLVALSPVLK